MGTDFENLIKIAKSKHTFKRFNDLSFLLKKVKYHEKHIIRLHPEVIEYLKRNTIKINDITDFPELKFDGTHETKIITKFEIELHMPYFFEFDSFIIDVKRCVEYAIKFLAKCMDQNEPKSIESFFNSLNQESLTPSKFSILIKTECKELHIYLINEWENWISEINTYRTNSTHKSIPNKMLGKGTIFWTSVDSKNNPREIKVDYLKFQNQNADKYIESTSKKLDAFMTYILKFITKNCNW